MSNPSVNQTSPMVETDSAENVIRKAKFENNTFQSNAQASPSTPIIPTSESILSAYHQPSSLHPLSNLNSNLDYLTLDDSALSSIAGSQSVLPNRGWSDELCYGTGTVYVTGLGLGGLWGLKEGWLRSQAIVAGQLSKSWTTNQPPSPSPNLFTHSSSTTSKPTTAHSASDPKLLKSASTTAGSASGYRAGVGSVSWRLRLNAILNGITRRGSFTGNTCGILALMYNGFNCTLDRYRGQHDRWNSVISGALTGALFRCTAGPQKMLIASSLMALGAMSWSAVKPRLI